MKHPMGTVLEAPDRNIAVVDGVGTSGRRHISWLTKDGGQWLPASDLDDWKVEDAEFWLADA